MHQIRYFIGQVASFFLTLARLIPLRVHNEFDGKRIPETGPVTISLTTHGARLNKVWYTIESLARGTVSAPIVLWLDKEDYEQPVPFRLKRLVNRGLQIRCSDGNYGPHTKYWPIFQERVAEAKALTEGVGIATAPLSQAASATPDLMALRVVTADDDMIYPEWWLERLLTCSELCPSYVIAYRAHRVTLRNGKLTPYARWTATKSCSGSILNMATGVSGVLYPLDFMKYVVDQGPGFQDVCPKADDIWLHACAVRSNTKIRQVFSQQRNFAVVPSTQLGAALVMRNVLMGGNDVQAKRVYTKEDIARMAAAAKEEATAGKTEAE